MRDDDELDDRDNDQDLPSRRRRRDRDPDDYSEQPHRGTMILILGIGGIILPIVMGCAPVGIVLSILAWKWGKKDQRLMDDGQMDPEGRGQTQAGMICGIIGTVINALYFALILAYIVVIAGFFAMAANAPPPGQGGPGMPAPQPQMTNPAPEMKPIQKPVEKPEIAPKPKAGRPPIDDDELK